jgi:transcriptional regulator with XRE-family HTH domain
MRQWAHFSMSLALKELARVYTRAVQFDRVRELLRVRRDALGWTLDKLQDEAGVNRATIHSIENLKREPDLKPDLETIEKLAVAMGLTLSSVFIEIEHGIVLEPKEISKILEGTQSAVTRVGDSHVGPAQVSSPDREALDQLRQFITDLSTALSAVATGGTPTTGPLPKTGTDETGGG